MDNFFMYSFIFHMYIKFLSGYFLHLSSKICVIMKKALLVTN